MSTESQIKNRIAEFVKELELEVRKNTLGALKDVLEGRAAPARRGRPPGAKRGPGRPPASGGTDNLAAKIASHVSANPGQSVGDIVSAIGANPAAVKSAIKSMLAEKQIRKAGEKRGTKYFPAGPGRLPGAVVKRAKRKARKAKRRSAPKKKARRAAPKRAPKKARKAPTPKRKRASIKAVVVPARKKRLPAPNEGTMVPQHLETPALAGVG